MEIPPISWGDILGLFCSDTTDEAAKAATDKWNPRSIKEDLEHCGMICKKKRKCPFYRTGEDCYFATHTKGTISGCSPTTAPCPKDTEEVGAWHTHGAMIDENKDGIDDRYDTEHFSPDVGNGTGDIPFAKKRRHPLYLGTPLGSFQKYDPKSGTISQLGTVKTGTRRNRYRP